ncbi:hypothetical protein GMMP15_720028 [Candidatus Magnetomoraceae bacterium gMMP-15]
MNFPYGISDFRKLVTKDYFYCDRTNRIPLLEKGQFVVDCLAGRAWQRGCYSSA